ncbi:DUF4007 family protein [Sporosarcina ureae]|uniref:DUF4007 family protein n=1 Tax=Sporosarcina ureae TaxID=1571 RepID=UPI000A17BD7B|nr:DUF4007 family protein [Sporosarcina ureae]ARK22058.1 hypothetical protein SporoP32a_11330 [Sporosarcina ureae]
MGYNQHQSFYLRDRWLSKAIRNTVEQPSFLYEKDAFEKIGLGKNMVQSLRHWVKATGVMEEDRKSKTYELTELGKWVKEQDITVQHFETAALLHYFLVKDKEPSSTWYWFFNLFSETVTTKEEIFTELSQWVQSVETRVVSENSIKRDVDCLIRMYTAGGNNEDPEEVTLSPLFKLGLLVDRNGTIYKREPSIPRGQYGFLLYTLLVYCEENDRYEIDIEEIIEQEGMWGRVYNLSRVTIVNILNDLTLHTQYPIAFIRTNNLDMLRVPRVDSNKFLYEVLKLKG